MAGRRPGGFAWPDSRHLVYQRTDVAGLEQMTIADATRPERAAERWPYPRPGRKNADVGLGIVPVAGGETVWVDWDRERYEYLAQVTWERNAPPTILVRTVTSPRVSARSPTTSRASWL